MEHDIAVKGFAGFGTCLSMLLCLDGTVAGQWTRA